MGILSVRASYAGPSLVGGSPAKRSLLLQTLVRVGVRLSLRRILGTQQMRQDDLDGAGDRHRHEGARQTMETAYKGTQIKKG